MTSWLPNYSEIMKYLKLSNFCAYSNSIYKINLINVKQNDFPAWQKLDWETKEIQFLSAPNWMYFKFFSEDNLSESHHCFSLLLFRLLVAYFSEKTQN